MIPIDDERSDDGLVSTVRGTRIHITSDILGNVLACPVNGMTANAIDDRGVALSRLLEINIGNIEEVQANQLPLELRLLHNICSRVLFPKTGRFEYVSERDIIIMDSVISGYPINLPGMMIWYMAEAASKKRAILPYGMILTRNFQSQDVNIMENEPKKLLRHTDYYNKATLHRMGFSKINGRWVRKGSQDVRTDDVGAGVRSPSEGEPSVRHASPGPSCPTPPAPPPAPGSSTQSSAGFSEVQLNQIRSLLDVHKVKLKNDLNSSLVSLNGLLCSLDNKIGEIKADFASSMADLKDDLVSKFADLKESSCTVELKEKFSGVSACFEKKLDDFVKIQSEELKKFVEEIKK